MTIDPRGVAPTRGQFVSAVAANESLCREHFKLVLRLDAFPPTRPGQFVQVKCADDATAHDEPIEWDLASPPRFDGVEVLGRTAMLRRPFSLAGRRDLPGGAVELDLIYRTVGVGTDWLAQLAVGDAVDVIGPLGNAFPLPDRDSVALLVGGGVGIPPMIYLASALVGRPAVAFCGAVTRDLLALSIDPTVAATSDPLDGSLGVREFAAFGVRTIISTDDGSLGERGYVTQALERWLDRETASGKTPKPTIYTCGPEPMMRRIADIAAARGLTVHIAVERAMACGMGTCQSCVIKVRTGATTDGSDSAWRYRLACTDGPVFAGSDLLW